MRAAPLSGGRSGLGGDGLPWQWADGVLSRKMCLAGQKGRSCGGGGCPSECIRLDFMRSDCGLMRPKPILHASAAIERCSEVVVAFMIPLFGQRLPDSLTQEVGVLLAYARAFDTPPGMAPMWGTRGCRCVVGRCPGWLPSPLRFRLSIGFQSRLVECAIPLYWSKSPALRGVVRGERGTRCPVVKPCALPGVACFSQLCWR